MKGLLIKEFYSMRTVMKQFGLIVIGMGIWCAFLKNPAFFPMITSMYGAMMILTSMSYDETVHFDKYQMTLPLSRSQVVVSKYLVLVLLVAAGMAVGIAGDAVLRLVVTGTKGTLLEDIISLSMVGAFFLFAFSVLLPVTFKMGVEKARLVLVAIYFLLFGGLYAIVSLLGGVTEMNAVFTMMEAAPQLVVTTAIAIAVLVLSVSCWISVEIVKKKEW